MPRARSPNRVKAKELWVESGKKRRLKDIAKELGVSEEQVRKWKNQDKWESDNKVTLPKGKSNVTKQKGGQPGNKNAEGHGAPEGNKNAEKYGFFSKYLPEDSIQIIQDIESKDTIDMLWENILIQYTAIIRAQRIMYVTGKDEMIKELKKKKDADFDNGSSTEEEWNFQFAWDRQANFLTAQSRAMAELRSMIKQYDEFIKSGLATEEQKLRIEKLKAEVDIIRKGPGDEKKAEDWAKAVEEVAARRREKMQQVNQNE